MIAYKVLVEKEDTEYMLAQLLNHSESSKGTEEQGNSLALNFFVGNTNDHIFESLKSIRQKRIRDTKSPRFESVSSKNSSNNISFGGQRSSSFSKTKLQTPSKYQILILFRPKEYISASV